MSQSVSEPPPPLLLGAGGPESDPADGLLVSGPEMASAGRPER